MEVTHKKLWKKAVVLGGGVTSAKKSLIVLVLGASWLYFFGILLKLASIGKGVRGGLESV